MAICTNINIATISGTCTYFDHNFANMFPLGHKSECSLNVIPLKHSTF